MKPRFYSANPPWVTLLWWLDHWRAVVFAAIAGLYLLAVNGRWRITSDSAWYVWRASGGGPADIGLGATPPGLVWMIAALGGEPGWLTATAMLAIAAVVLWLVYELFKEHADRPTAVLMVLLTALSGMFMEMSYNLLTELPFTAGLVLLLWGHERRLKRKQGLWLALSMMAAGVLWMAMFRSVVAVVVGAYVAAEVIRVLARSDQRTLGMTIIGVALCGAAVIWFGSPAVRDDAAIFQHAIQSKTSEQWWISVRALMTEALPEAIFGQDVPPSLAWPASLIIVFTGLMLVKARLLWGVLWVAVLVQWVVFLSDGRYMLPVLPVVFFGLWRGVVSRLGRWGEPWRGLGFFVVALALFGANVASVVNIVGEQRSDDFYETYRSGKYAAVVELAEVIQAQTPPDGRLLFEVPVGIELMALTGRDTVQFGDNRPHEAPSPVFWVGPEHLIERPDLANPIHTKLGPPLGSAIDRRSGDVWQLRRFE